MAAFVFAGCIFSTYFKYRVRINRIFVFLNNITIFTED